ncbi:MAG: adenosylcobinamide-GDP ribazoletransferase [Lentisphaeraceae bacterium]|nr:adenosylcobinamide-GDP ribazoletransferase [Lentisphaeraceae bacterium]
MLSREIKIFLTALTFFTRIPSPKFEFKEEYLHHAAKYISLIGFIVGSLSFFSFYLSLQLFSPLPAIILSLVSSICITGAFHEDGLADMADGIGGGWSKDQKLKIMKDSRIGTYGAVTLILLFLLKASFLYELATLLNIQTIGLIFLASHMLSRASAGTLIKLLPYVQESDSSKSKPVVQMTNSSLILMTLISFIPLTFFDKLEIFLIIIPLLITILIFKAFLKRQLGGITGDCLGACQQISELVCLASFLVYFTKLVV